ncbi:MAG: DUF3313 family protein [Pseudomonadota bacterium]
MRTNTQSILGLAAAGLVALAGAGPAIAASAIDVSGFDEAYLEDGADLSAYSSVYVDAVGAEVEADENGQYNPRDGFSEAISQNEIDQRAETLRERLQGRLEDKVTMADGADAGVLVISATLTELAPSRPTLEGLSQEPSLSLSGSVAVGGAAVRIELIDGGDGAVIGRLEDRNFGRDLGDGRPRVGVWSDADRAFSIWSRGLARYLEDALGSDG